MSTGRGSRKRSFPQSLTSKVVKPDSDSIETLIVPEEGCSTSPKALESLNAASCSFIYDKGYNCPICFQLYREPYSTLCGHSFCHECIAMHLLRSNQCPVCGREFDPKSPIIPNFAFATVVEGVRSRIKISQLFNTVAEDETVSKDICDDLIKLTMKLDAPAVDGLIEVLQSIRQQKKDRNSWKENRILLRFIDDMIARKEALLDETQQQLDILRSDRIAVQAILTCFFYFLLIKCIKRYEDYLKDDKKRRLIGITSCHNLLDILDNELNECNSRLQKHMDVLSKNYFTLRKNTKQNIACGNETVGPCFENLGQFSQLLHGMSQYSGFRTIASLQPNTSSSHAIVSSIEFDKDGEYFAVAGVTCKVKIYEFGAVVDNPNTRHYPLMQLQCNSKISNVSWNPYTKNLLANSDYDGTVQVWDTYNSKVVRKYQEHEKRCWTVQFNSIDPLLMASGSDDAKVRLWSLSSDRSVATINANVNVCCVCFSPISSYHLVFGGTDRSIHLYDLRNISKAVNVFQGHYKPISYVKYVTRNEVVSAATDSQLRIWDVNTGSCIRTLKGHLNEKNFVGLATDGNHVVCGSENNQLYLYYKGLSDPLMQHDFGNSLSCQTASSEGDSSFVSAVCWKKDSRIILAANSQGQTRILQLV
uniref:RING-type domain-containing protein n=1 Tax=Syphacia muris TaxID=451379 RepID=A0A0N5ART3_9BILA